MKKMVRRHNQWCFFFCCALSQKFGSFTFQSATLDHLYRSDGTLQAIFLRSQARFTMETLIFLFWGFPVTFPTLFCACLLQFDGIYFAFTE
jgi:hypothetical protein